MIRIFLLEDDFTFGKNLKLYLLTHGYDVVWGQDLAQARNLYSKSKFHLALLDWSLPDGTGLEFLKSIEASQRIPTLFLTARESEDSAVEALAEGARDYLRKPFGQKELLIKIKQATGEAHGVQKIIRYDDLSLNDTELVAFWGQVALKLRRREFSILKLLILKAEDLVTRESVLAVIDNSENKLFDRTVDSHISRLRKALKEAGANGIEIESVYGSGYRLKRVA